MDDIKVIRFPLKPQKEGVYEECKEDRAHADEAAELIGQSFVWDATAEGRDFWVDVTERLRQIARNGRLK